VQAPGAAEAAAVTSAARLVMAWAVSRCLAQVRAALSDLPSSGVGVGLAGAIEEGDESEGREGRRNR